jgi:hypothetical protein
LVKTVNENLSEVAATITCPVVLFYGTDDTETPPDIGQRPCSHHPACGTGCPERVRPLHNSGRRTASGRSQIEWVYQRGPQSRMIEIASTIMLFMTYCAFVLSAA